MESVAEKGTRSMLEVRWQSDFGRPGKRSTSEFGKEFTVRNLGYMRRLFLIFSKRNSLRSESEKPKRDAPRLESIGMERFQKMQGESSWTHQPARQMRTVGEPKRRGLGEGKRNFFTFRAFLKATDSRLRKRTCGPCGKNSRLVPE